MAIIKHTENYYPWMTGNALPSPFKANASQNAWGAYRAFNEEMNDDITLSDLSDSAKQWIEITLDKAIKIWGIKLMFRTTMSAGDAGWVPKNFILFGSNDGSTYHLIRNFVDRPADDFCKFNRLGDNKYDWSAAEVLEVTCEEAYKIYRFSFGEAQNISKGQTVGSATTVKCTRFEIYEEEGENEPPVEETFNVTVTNGSGTGVYTPGDIVTCIANTYEGKDFVSWTTTGLVDVDKTKATCTFTMPRNDVTLLATYKNHSTDIPVESVHIYLDTATIGVGEYATISTEVLPENATNPNLTLSVEDTTVCRLENDKVFGVSAGVTNIKAESHNGVVCLKQITVLGQRDASDADFNAQSRELHMKLEIFFDGLDKDPLVVTRENYLIDCNLLEEASAESNNPLGAISSNELSFNLFNKQGMFSPTNKVGPYSGKIKTGLPIKPYIRPNIAGVSWVQMGLYYVSDWNATITGAAASVVANDKLQSVFLEPTPAIPVELNQSFKQLLQRIFKALGYDVIVSDDLDELLLYSFIEGKPVEFLQEIMQGATSYCTCDKNGNIRIEQLNRFTDVRATITDSDQIISVDAKQSIIKSYGGVELTYSLPQLTEQVQVLLAKDLSVPVGIYTHNKMSFSKGPVKRINNLYALSDNHNIFVLDYENTPWDLTFTTQNDSPTVGLADIAVYGIAVDFVKAVLTDGSTNVLKADSRYIQNTAYATKYKKILNAFVSSDMPTLTLSVRGNPLFNIGDKIRVVSNNYNLDFTGFLQRINYDYTGSLSCKITLLNTSILEEVK